MKNYNLLLIILGIYTSLLIGQCDSSYIYIEDIPDNVTILDGNNCFLYSDLNALDDVIDNNDLSLLSPLEIGTQTWTEGRLRFFIAGNYYSGGYLSLTTIPNSFGNLTDLRMLYLNWNNLTSIPESFDQLINLMYLILSNNQLVTLFDNIGNLQNLIYLDLGYNQLEAIPESVGQLQSLVYLYIFVNQLSALPESICDLNVDWNAMDGTFLPYFGSGGNLLCENIPECIANSDNFEIGLDQTYYSFAIDMPQDCQDPYTLGDINDDGSIDILDIVAVVSFILGDTEFTEPQLFSADVNLDNSVDILDIVMIVGIILYS